MTLSDLIRQRAMIDAAAFEGIGTVLHDEPGDGHVLRYSRWKQGSCPECRQPMQWKWRQGGERVLHCVNPECAPETTL